MRRSMFLPVSAMLLAGCNASGDDAANQAAARAAAQPKKPRPAYCFFKDGETKGWTAKRDKDGNIVVKGKAHLEDSRYKALLNPATVSGTTADIAPTISMNDGYAAPENMWTVTATIPNSAAVTAVNVRCGASLVAALTVPPKA